MAREDKGGGVRRLCTCMRLGASAALPVALWCRPPCMLRHSPHACMVVTGYWVGQGSGTALHFSHGQAVHGGYWLPGQGVSTALRCSRGCTCWVLATGYCVGQASMRTITASHCSRRNVRLHRYNQSRTDTMLMAGYRHGFVTRVNVTEILRRPPR